MDPFSIFDSGKGQPDWGGDINDVMNAWNQAIGMVKPSQAALNQTSALQNQMTNQQYNQGLSGSTMGNQALGSGEMGAFQSDIDQQAKSALGMLPMIAGGNLAAQMLPGQSVGQLIGMLIPSLLG